MAKAPPAEVDITADLVRALLAAQHPDLAELPLAPAGSGWDNAMWRLGDELAVRLPRRAMAAPLASHEQRWLPELARRLPVPIPVPVRAGVPSPLFAWHWSVVPWFAGRRAAALGGSGRSLLDDVVALVAALHRPAPAEAPKNPFRGVHLAERAGPVALRLADPGLAERVEEHLGDVPGALGRLRSVWDAALEAPCWDGPRVWLHGDLHPANLLVDGAGRLAAVIDFGDLCSGDPATDLSAAWMLFDGQVRGEFVRRVAAACDLDEHVWLRARGWATAVGAVLVLHADDSPDFAVVGERTLRAVLED